MLHINVLTGDLEVPAILGIVLGCAVGILILMLLTVIIIGVLLCYRRKGKTLAMQMNVHI